MCPRGTLDGVEGGKVGGMFSTDDGLISKNSQKDLKGMDFLLISEFFCVVFLKIVMINFVSSTFLPLIFRSSPFKWIGFFCSRI